MSPLVKDGFSIEELSIRDLDIRPCDDCGTCYDGSSCPIGDDMPRVLDVLKRCSAITIATPVYFYGVPAKAKALIDRCQVLWAQKYELANPLPAGRQAAIIVTGESGGKKMAEGIRLTLKYFLDVLSIQMPNMHVVRHCNWPPEETPRKEIKKAIEYGKEFLERITGDV